jgi:hypothetical protein
MDFALSANQESIRDAIEKICSRFDDVATRPTSTARWRMPDGSASASPRNMAGRGWASRMPRS